MKNQCGFRQKSCFETIPGQMESEKPQCESLLMSACSRPSSAGAVAQLLCTNGREIHPFDADSVTLTPRHAAKALPHTCSTGKSCAPSPSPQQSPHHSPRSVPCRAASPAHASLSQSCHSRKEERHMKCSIQLLAGEGRQKTAFKSRPRGEGA